VRLKVRYNMSMAHVRWLLPAVLLASLAVCARPVLAPTPTLLPTAAAIPHLQPPPYRSPTPGIEARPVSCAASDGVVLAGTLYGHGAAAVIFSNRSDKGRDSWASMAQRAGAAGYLALTYDYRAYNATGNVDVAPLNLADSDLRGAIACVKLLGAGSIVLVGASIGGMTSAKEAATTQAAALIIVGSPMSNPDLTLRVSVADLQNAVPKLFIASEHDSLVAAGDTRAMYEAAAEPKTFYQYPTDAHGTDLLLGAFAEDFGQRLLDFIRAHAPATS
jgi:hypothetical protein